MKNLFFVFFLFPLFCFGQNLEIKFGPNLSIPLPISNSEITFEPKIGLSSSLSYNYYFEENKDLFISTTITHSIIKSKQDWSFIYNVSAFDDPNPINSLIKDVEVQYLDLLIF